MIIITGQTATGKTALALKYAKELNGELVNFDSRQVYKYLDIITGKDLPARINVKNNRNKNINTKKIINNDLNSVWLYDVVNPNEYFSSYEYVKQANIVIKDIENRGKTPILVGGTYFYLKHLLYDFDFKVPPNLLLRDKLNVKTVIELQEMLNKLNSQVQSNMNNSDWQNPRRLIRKIEIEEYIKNNKEKKDLVYLKTSKEKKKINYKIDKFIGLYYENKEDLKKVIKKRVEERLKNGAVEEVERVLNMGYKKTDYGLKTIGYKEIIEYLDKKVTLDKAIENWITKELQYAKKQYTFMKKDKNINWIKL